MVPFRGTLPWRTRAGLEWETRAFRYLGDFRLGFLSPLPFFRDGPSVRSGSRLSLRFQIACFFGAVPFRDLDIGIMSRTFIDKSSSPQIDAPARVMGCAVSRYEQEIAQGDRSYPAQHHRHDLIGLADLYRDAA